MARPKIKTAYTPVGVAAYAHLNRPDSKFVKEGEAPKYSVKLRFDPNSPEWQQFQTDMMEGPFAEQLEAYKAENKKHAKRITTKYAAFREVIDDDGNETGEFEIVVKMNSWYVRDGKKIALAPGFADTKGKSIKAGKVPNIWGGSKLRLAVRPLLNGQGPEVTYSWQLVGVQIIELAESNSGSGFGEYEGEDGGYEFEDDDDSGFGDASDGADDDADDEPEDGDEDF